MARTVPSSQINDDDLPIPSMPRTQTTEDRTARVIQMVRGCGPTFEAKTTDKKTKTRQDSTAISTTLLLASHSNTSSVSGWQCEPFWCSGQAVR